VRRPTLKVIASKTPGMVGQTLIQNDENVQVDCEVKFDALILVRPNQIGRLFFRQYVMSLVRKENACERGPMGVEKGPALDTLAVYNHVAGGDRTGLITTTGQEDDVEMIDDDAPAQTVDSPVCKFENGAQVSLHAADKFRMYVMWEPQGGAPVSLGYKEWSWKATASFTKKSYGEWDQSITDPEGPKDLSGSIVAGDVPQTSENINPNNIMVGKKKISSF
jgi:hypothetical protein